LDGIPLEASAFDTQDMTKLCDFWLSSLSGHAGATFRKAASHGGAVWLSSEAASELASHGHLGQHMLFAETSVIGGVQVIRIGVDLGNEHFRAFLNHHSSSNWLGRLKSGDTIEALMGIPVLAELAEATGGHDILPPVAEIVPHTVQLFKLLLDFTPPKTPSVAALGMFAPLGGMPAGSAADAASTAGSGVVGSGLAATAVQEEANEPRVRRRSATRSASPDRRRRRRSRSRSRSAAPGRRPPAVLADREAAMPAAVGLAPRPRAAVAAPALGCLG
jgi:hypothetical protein